MTITALPALDRLSATFKADVDTFFGTRMPAFVTEANTVAAAMNLNSTNDTSASSVAVGLGAKSFTVTTGKSFVGGMYLAIASTAAPSTNSMWGQVTSYNSGTGALVMNIISIIGSGTIASWTISQSGGGVGLINTLVRSARTGNTILSGADRQTQIDITSGTFSQTFTAAATLGSGWFCYIRNNGTGVITLDPDGAELIDSAATVTLAPGFRAIVLCTGTEFFTMIAEPVVGDHAIIVTTGTGHGSTNTKIRRFTTTQSSVGTHVTYADSATLGATFTIAAGGAGLYAIGYTDYTVAASSNHGVSLNSAQLTTDIHNITAANRLVLHQTTAAAPTAATIVTRLAVGDVVRPHTTGVNDAVAAWNSVFSIRKVGL